MIRQAKDADFPQIANNEVLVRICGLRAAYGTDAPFIRYYTDDSHSLLAIMDGVGLFHSERLAEEWGMFLAMNPDIGRVHCDYTIGKELINSGVWQGRVGETMLLTLSAPISVDKDVCTTPYLPDVYELLKNHFPDISPFNSWYPDVSHRIRHGNSHIAAVLNGDSVVSTAMAVAEADNAAILGQVATHPDFRRRGLAEKCIKSTVAQCKVKSLYILPIDERARNLYEKLGFKVVGAWAELERIH